MERPRTRVELANDLGMSPRTLHRRLIALGYMLPKGLVMPIDQRKVIDLLGFNFESLYGKLSISNLEKKERHPSFRF